MEKIFKNVEEINPLVHCITNYVTVNDVANILLAIKASPIMADDKNEVEEIVSISKALVINIGTLNERTLESMILAGKKANELNIPVVLDPVGAGASKFRTEDTNKILKEVKLAVISGNISEIKSIYEGTSDTKGVDVNKEDIIKEDNLEKNIKMAKVLSKKLNTVISISGEIDIISNSEKSYLVRNGHEIMPFITGTGCMLSALTGAFIGANKDEILQASLCATLVMGISGERAYEKMIENKAGTSTFRNYLIDEVYNMTYEKIRENSKVESK